MKTELWSPTLPDSSMDNSGTGEPWHFQNALFEDLRGAAKTSKSSSTSNNSMSRQRYPCLACGEVKRWDQLTQHYKKFVQFDTMGIPSVPDQKMMTEKVYLHTALFFEKNFSRDRMPNYKDHIHAEPRIEEKQESTKGFSSKLNVPTGGDRTLINDQTNKSEEFLPFSTPASLFFHPNFSLQAAAATGLKMPPLKLSGSVGPMSSLGGRTRKRKRPNSSSSNHSPSQSRRFYKCLGCGSPKRWDRLTDHYRKYVLFGPLGDPLIPCLENMTPEQYVHTMAFRDQGFTSDRMPQYKDHVEANNDNHDVIDAHEEDVISNVTDESTNNSFTENEIKYSSPSQPNMEDYWQNKVFADCKIICKGGEEILTHRLILAAHNEYFYQLLVNTAAADLDTAVILMPDHSSQDVVNMVQQLYNFKVNNTAFLFDEKLHEYRITDTAPSPGLSKKIRLEKSVKVVSRESSKFLKSLKDYTSNTSLVLENTEKNETLDQDYNVNEEQATEDDPDPMDTSASNYNNEFVDRLILKTGTNASPLFWCQFAGCNFSVKKSLLCMKGHILAEHLNQCS